jgi:hypothetical protein
VERSGPLGRARRAIADCCRHRIAACWTSSNESPRSTSPAFAHGASESREEIQAAIAEVRRATQAFHDVEEARRAGYS